MELNIYLLTIISLLIIVILVQFWMKKKSDNDFKELFDGLEGEFEDQLKNLKNIIDGITSTNELLETYNKIIKDKSLEIEEYKEVSLLNKQKGLFTSLIDILSFIDKFNQESQNLDESTKNYLVAIKDKLEITISSAGIEKYNPEINSNILEVEGCNASFHTNKTKDFKKVNLISRVIRPGYRMQVKENKFNFIRNAEVEIFELEKNE